MDDKEMRNYIYLRGMLDTFQKRAFEYYLKAASDEERFERLKNIRELLLNRRQQPSLLEDGSLSGSWLSVAGFRIRGDETPTEYPNCSSGEVCRGGVCVDARLPLEWGDSVSDDPTDN